MNSSNLLSKFVDKIEVEILTSGKNALIGGSADCTNNSNYNSSYGNNCPPNGNNCPCFLEDKGTMPNHNDKPL